MENIYRNYINNNPQQMHPQQMHPQQMHPQQMHPQQMHPQQMHPQQMHQQQMHPQQMHPQQMHQQQMHPQQMHPQQMHPQQMHPQQMNPQQMHPQQMNPQQMHPQQMNSQMNLHINPKNNFIPMYKNKFNMNLPSNMLQFNQDSQNNQQNNDNVQYNNQDNVQYNNQDNVQYNNQDNVQDSNQVNDISLPITPPIKLESLEGSYNQKNNKSNNKGDEKFIDNFFKCKSNDIDEFLYSDDIVFENDNFNFKNNNYCNRNITSTFSNIALVDKNIDAFNPKYIDNPRDLNEKIDFIEINNNKSLDLTRIIDYNHLLDIDGAIWDSIFVKNSPNRLIYLLHKFNNSILPFHVNNEGNNLVHLISMSSKDNGVFIDKLIVYYCRYKLDEQFKESFMNKNKLGTPALHLTVMFSAISVAEKIVQINPLTIQQKDNQNNLATNYCSLNKKKGKVWMSRIQFIINKQKKKKN